MINIESYHSTIARSFLPFFVNRMLKLIEYEPEMHCGVPVRPAYNRAILTELSRGAKLNEQPHFDLFTSLCFTVNSQLGQGFMVRNGDKNSRSERSREGLFRSLNSLPTIGKRRPFFCPV